MTTNNRILGQLFLTFAKIGAFTFGGGYAMIPIIEQTCVEEKQWLTHDEMMDIMVVAESTPGPMAINCATYVGLRRAGLTGSLIATLGIVLPSFIVIYLISMFLDNFLEITLIANAFQGIRIAVGLLILNAALNMRKKMKNTTFSKAVLCISCGAMLAVDLFGWKFSSIAMMLVAGVVSLAMFLANGQTVPPCQKGGESK